MAKKKRKGLSNKLRFEVFKRDYFTCQYCGGTPPSAVLQVDHVDPVANGGGDEIDNLVTACEECNNGKSDRLLSVVPESLAVKMETVKERELQLRQYRAFLRKQRQRELADIEAVSDYFTLLFPTQELTHQFKRCSLKRFLQNLTVEQLCDNLDLACSTLNKRHGGSAPVDDVVSYFCGICWKQIRGVQQ